MKKNNLVKLLGIGLVVAIISTGLFYGLFVSKLNSSVGSGKTMVVAANAIKANTVLTATDVKTIPWPTDQLPTGAFEKPEDVAGKTVWDAISEGEPVLASRLATASGQGSTGVPAGMRAISVHVTDSTGIVSMLRAGQKVDVQVIVNHTAAPVNAEVRTALEDLQVLSVTPQPEQSSQGRTLPVVTLLAAPADADVLALADSGAQIRLTLRNPLDDAGRSRAPLTLDAVMRTSGKSTSGNQK